MELNPETKKSVFKSKYAYRQIWASIVANFLQAMQGSVLALSSIILPKVIGNTDANEVTLSVDQGSWFASIYCIGYVYGSLLGGLQSDYLGRRTSLFIDCLVATVGILLVANTYQFHFLMIGRLLCGQASGSGTVTIPIYISEISNPEVRAITGPFFTNFYFFGYSVTTILGSFINWRIATNIISACPILGAFLLLTCYESPDWLLQNGKMKRANESLKYFHGENAQAENDLIVTNIRRSQTVQSMAKRTMFAKMKSLLSHMNRPSFRKPFFILFMIVPVFCQWNGLSIIAFYLVMFLKRIQGVINPFYAASILTVLRAVVANFSVFILRSQPVRRVYITAASFMILGAAIIALYHHLLILNVFSSFNENELNIVHWAPAIGFLIYYLASSSGYFQITYMIQGEILPPRVRSIGCGLLGFIDGISSFLAAKMAPLFLESYGANIYFTYATIMCVLIVVFAYFCLPETHGKRLQEIEDFFGGSRSGGIDFSSLDAENARTAENIEEEEEHESSN